MHSTDEKITTISITSGTMFRAVMIGIIFVGLYFVRDVLLVVLTGVVIASAIEPGTLWLVKNRIPRIVAVILIYLAVFLLLIALFYSIIPPILTETSSLISTVPQYIKVAELWAPLKHVAPLLHIPDTIPVTSLVGQISAGISAVSGGLFDTASNFLGGVFSLLLIIIISFYLAVQENGVEHFLKIIVPAKNEGYIIGLWQRTQVKIGRWMQGQIILQLIVGVLIYLGLIILHIPHPLVLGVFAFVFELIPVFGMSMAAIPAVLLGLINGGLTLGILVAALYFIVQQFESNLIYPLVVKKVVGIPPLLVIIALIVGAKLGGLIGIILSVPLSVAVMEYLDERGKRKFEESNAAQS